MQVKNVEQGLLRTMAAVFKKQGLSDVAANAKATKHLAGARSVFEEAEKPPRTTARPTARELLGHAVRSVAAAAKPAASERRRGPSIKSTSKKITSAEQSALRKVTAPSRVKDLVASKPGTRAAAALGAVSKWAKSLP